MSSPTDLRRPLVRRIGRLNVRLSKDGVAIRARHRQKWHKATWQQIAAAAMQDPAADKEAVARLLADIVGDNHQAAAAAESRDPERQPGEKTP